jgi:hypothetical protein
MPEEKPILIRELYEDLELVMELEWREPRQFVVLIK